MRIITTLRRFRVRRFILPRVRRALNQHHNGRIAMATMKRERSARLFVSVPQSLHERIQQVAASNYETTNDYIRRVVTRTIVEQQQREVSDGRQ